MDQNSRAKESSLPAERSFAPIRPQAADGFDFNPIPIDKPLVITDKEVDGYKEQDRFLPIANVSRIMKKSLPNNTKISKEAKECVQECTSEFISFVTSEASERCTGERRKTLSGEDVLYALTALGFENYSDVLTIYLAKWRNRQFLEGKRRRGSGRQLIKKGREGEGVEEGLVEGEEEDEEEDDEEEEDEGEEEDGRDAKRPRVDQVPAESVGGQSYGSGEFDFGMPSGDDEEGEFS